MCFKGTLLCALKGLYYVFQRDCTMCFKGIVLCALKGTVLCALKGLYCML